MKIKYWLLFCLFIYQCSYLNLDNKRKLSSTDIVATPLVIKTSERVIVIGDIHGDYQTLISVLRMANLIDDNSRWIGGKTIVVFLGDFVDGWTDDKKVLDYLISLTLEAREEGGEIYSVLGEHELLNIQGKFNHVHNGAFRTFGKIWDENLFPIIGLHHSRFKAFKPGGYYAEWLSQYNVFLIVNDTLFAHAGIHSSHLKLGLESINEETRRWMLGKIDEVPEVILSDVSPLKMKTFLEINPSDCPNIKSVLKKLKVKRMVIGHFLQPNGISNLCDEKVWRVDVGLSKAFRSQFIAEKQILEIVGNDVKVIREL